jgi:hypothetical protein
MAPAVQYSHCLLSLPRFLPEACLSLRARPSRITAFLARPRPTTITAFRTPHGDALYPQLPRSGTTRIQPVPRMTDQTELPGPKPDP